MLVVSSSLSFCPLVSIIFPFTRRPPTVSVPIDLSFQTAARILAAPAVEALNVMKDLSQNFPTKARYPLRPWRSCSESESYKIISPSLPPLTDPSLKQWSTLTSGERLEKTRRYRITSSFFCCICLSSPTCLWHSPVDKVYLHKLI